MSDIEIIDRIAAAVAERITPPIPLASQLWNGKMIANYLHRAPTQVMQRVVTLTNFPKQIRLPTLRDGASSQPLWKAIEVIQWAESHQEKAIGRPRRED